MPVMQPNLSKDPLSGPDNANNNNNSNGNNNNNNDDDNNDDDEDEVNAPCSKNDNYETDTDKSEYSVERITEKMVIYWFLPYQVERQLKDIGLSVEGSLDEKKQRLIRRIREGPPILIPPESITPGSNIVTPAVKVTKDQGVGYPTGGEKPTPVTQPNLSKDLHINNNNNNIDNNKEDEVNSAHNEDSVNPAHSEKQNYDLDGTGSSLHGGTEGNEIGSNIVTPAVKISKDEGEGDQAGGEKAMLITQPNASEDALSRPDLHEEAVNSNNNNSDEDTPLRSEEKKNENKGGNDMNNPVPNPVPNEFPQLGQDNENNDNDNDGGGCIDRPLISDDEPGDHTNNDNEDSKKSGKRKRRKEKTPQTKSRRRSSRLTTKTGTSLS